MSRQRRRTPTVLPKATRPPQDSGPRTSPSAWARWGCRDGKITARPRVVCSSPGMSRRLLKFSGGSVTQFLTWSRFQGRVSETATAYTALGVRPSNRCGNDVYSCCAPTMPTAALGDGRVGLPRANRVRRLPTEDALCASRRKLGLLRVVLAACDRPSRSPARQVAKRSS